jgi:predicted Rossmann fold flavoprotein
VLLDGARKPGAKILVSGGSRCNVTNTVVTEHDFWGGSPASVRRVLRAFPVAETVSFFRELGVPLHEEADGKLFPDTNRARDVLDALLREAARSGVTLMPDHRVVNLERDGHCFRVETTRGALGADRVVLATGGQALPKSGSDGAGLALTRALGHSIVPTTPALAPLVLAREHVHRELSGVSHPAELTLRIDNAVAIRLSGSLLWTHFGISGPAVLNLSRHWLRADLEGRSASVTANFAAPATFEDEERRWIRLVSERPRTSVLTALAIKLPAAFANRVLTTLAADAREPLAHFTRDRRRDLVHALTAWPLPIVGSRGYTYAEATAGGVALTEVDPKTMESRICPGLWLVGEMLDVDGRIGGFNFQWAWSSGYVAGRALASRPTATPDR